MCPRYAALPAGVRANQNPGHHLPKQGAQKPGLRDAAREPGKYPCVIFCCGSHNKFCQLELPHATVLATITQHGYVVITSRLRGTPSSEGKDQFGRANMLDVISYIPDLAQLLEADTSRIGTTFRAVNPRGHHQQRGPP